MPHEGNYSSWMEAKHKRLRLDNIAEARQKKAMGRELEWIRSNVKGGRTKSKVRLFGVVCWWVLLLPAYRACVCACVRAFAPIVDCASSTAT